MRAMLVSALLIVTACGDGAAGAGDEGGTGSLCDGTANVTGCQMAWTGMVTGETECNALYDVYLSATLLQINSLTPVPAYARLGFAEPPTVGEYVLADLLFGTGGIKNTGLYEPNYLMERTDTSMRGELSLTIESLDADGRPHGHLRMVAPDATMPTDEVELCAQF